MTGSVIISKAEMIKGPGLVRSLLEAGVPCDNTVLDDILGDDFKLSPDYRYTFTHSVDDDLIITWKPINR